jgi:hypothetical protein
MENLSYMYSHILNSAISRVSGNTSNILDARLLNPFPQNWRLTKAGRRFWFIQVGTDNRNQGSPLAGPRIAVLKVTGKVLSHYRNKSTFPVTLNSNFSTKISSNQSCFQLYWESTYSSRVLILPTEAWEHSPNYRTASLRASLSNEVSFCKEQLGTMSWRRGHLNGELLCSQTRMRLIFFGWCPSWVIGRMF